MGKGNRRSGFKFDVGFVVPGPDGITEAVERATGDVQKLEKALYEVQQSRLREPAKVLSDLQTKAAMSIDESLAAPAALSQDFDARINLAIDHALSDSIYQADQFDTGAAPIVSPDERSDDRRRFDFGGLDPDGPAPFQPDPPADQPQILQAARPVNCPPNPRGPLWQYYLILDCRKVDYVVLCWNDPQIGQPWAIIISIGPNYDALVAHGASLRKQVAQSTRCDQCKKQMGPAWNHPSCVVKPPAAPPPPPAPAPAPKPPTTPPTTPPKTPTTPPTTPPCPAPPAKDFCVWQDSTGCVYTAYQKGTTPPSPGGADFICGLEPGQATAVASALTSASCQTQGAIPQAPSGGSIGGDPLCDPLGYCVYLTGGPVSPGQTPATGQGPISQFIARQSPSAVLGPPIVQRIVNSVVAGIWDFGVGIAKYLDDLVLNFKWPKCKNVVQLAYAHRNLVAYDFLSIFLGKSFRRLGIPNEYIANASCPQLFPDEKLATTAYLAGSINDKTLECWVAMNDFCVEPWKAVVDSSAKRITVDEAVELHRSGFISDQEYIDAARRQGVIDPAQSQAMMVARNPKFSPQDLVRLKNFGEISPTQFENGLRRHGFKGADEVRYWNSLGLSRFGPHELNQLRNRGLINDNVFQEQLFSIGYVGAGQVAAWAELGQFIPPYSDLVRMMVRDVADPAAVADFQMDDQFGDKYQGRLKDWAKAQGISDEIMQYIWRAHWSIPSPTQLFAMLHRFRHPGHPTGLQITEDTIRRALIQQDILPSMVDYVMALSYSPLTRVDVRRAYEIGAMDLDAVWRAYINLGYSDEDAEILKQFAKRQLVDKLRRSPLVNKVASLDLTLDDLRIELDRFQIDQDDKDAITDHAKKLAARKSAATCVKNLRKRFMVGDITADQAQTALLRLGHDVDVVDQAINGWQCELATKSKQAQAAQLCKWFSDGLLADVEFVTRLRRLGWSEADAFRIVAQCSLRLAEKIGKEQQRQQKEAERKLKEAAKQAERAAQNQQKQQKLADKERLAEVKAEAKRDALLVKYSKRYADRHSLEIIPTFARVLAAKDAAMATHGIDDDQAVQAIVQAIDQEPKGSQDTLEDRIDQVAATVADAAGDGTAAP